MLSGLQVYSARTMGTVQRSHDTGIRGRFPTMVLQGNTAYLASMPDYFDFSGPLEVRQAPVSTGAWSSPMAVPGAFGEVPGLQADGSVLRLAYYRITGGRAETVVQQRTGGRWSAAQRLSIGKLSVVGNIRPPFFTGSGAGTVLGWTNGGTDPQGVILESHVQLAQLTAAGGWAKRQVTVDRFTELLGVMLRGTRILLVTDVIPSTVNPSFRGVYVRSQ